MSKFVSADTFSAYLTEDFNWRLKEITDLRKIATSVANGYEVAVRKAGIALLYAHWEGYVKFVGEAYIKYVAVRKITIESLTEEFFAMEISGPLKNYVGGPGDMSSRLSLIDEWRRMEKSQFKRIKDRGVSTGGNLNYQRFSEVCILFNIDPKKVIGNEEFLDKNILGVRNKIAHGESITVTEAEFLAASKFVIDAMRNFRTEAEFRVISKQYMRQALVGTVVAVGP